MVETSEGPEEQRVELLVPLYFFGRQEGAFPYHGSGAVTGNVGAESKVARKEIGLGDKCQAVTLGNGVQDTQGTENLKFVDETLLASFGALGNTGESAVVLAKKGHNKIGFTVISAL